MSFAWALEVSCTRTGIQAAAKSISTVRVHQKLQENAFCVLVMELQGLARCKAPTF